MGEFRMPALGADMEAGTLVEWLKHPGDHIKRGDIMAVVDTQKGAIEIEVFEDGVLDRVVVAPGEKVPVSTVLAVIRGAGEPVSAAATGLVAGQEEPSTVRIRVSPVARKLAEDLRVDLETVDGTGPGGAVTREDVQRASAAKVVAPDAVTGAGDRGAAMRAAIATAMTRSKREIPHYYLSTSIDMNAATAWLRAENERRPMPDRILAIALLVKAVALALKEVPELNGHWVDGGFRKAAGIHVGCAISLRGGGLVAPAVHDADGKDLGALTRGIRDLVTRARTGALKSSELADATITVTSLGEQGVDATFGIIHPPQVALVGFGRIVERPWIVSGRVEPRTVVVATLSADHRATDGHRGGVFLASVDRLLQAPEQL